MNTVAKSCKLVDSYIKRYKKKLKQAKDFFEETDCCETMHEIDSITYTLEVLKSLREEMSALK